MVCANLLGEHELMAAGPMSSFVRPAYIVMSFRSRNQTHMSLVPQTIPHRLFGGLSRSEFAYFEYLEEIQVKCGRKTTMFLWRKRIGAGVPGVWARHIPHCLIFDRGELISYHVLRYPQVCINILLLILNANSHRVYSVTQP